MRVAVMLVIMLMISVLPGVVHGESSSPVLKAQIPHGVIRINNDTDLDSIAQAEGWKGDGSEGNPYVIENYKIDARGNTSAIYIGNVTKYVVIRNCTVYNVTEITSYGWGSGVMIYQTSNVVIDNLTAYDIVQYGVYIGTDSSYVTVKNSRFYPGNKSTVAAITVSGYYARLINNTIVETTYGIWIHYGARTTLYSNNITGSSIYIDFASYSDEYDIPANNTVNGKPVIYITGFRNNQTVDLGNAGEVILGKASWATLQGLSTNNTSTVINVLESSNITIRNMRMENVSGNGIFVDWSENVTMDNITLTGSGSWGIRMMVVDDVYILNSTIMGHSGYFTDGIYMNNVHRVYVNYSEISGATHGLYLYSDLSHDITLNGCYVHDFTDYGFYSYNSVTSSRIKNVNILNSRFYDTGNNAIYLRVVESALVKNNTIWATEQSSTRNGVYVSDFSEKVVIEENNLWGLTTGIRLASVLYSYVRNNTVENTSYTSISLSNSKYNTVEYNWLNGSKAYGLYISASSNSNTIRNNYIGNATNYGIYIDSLSKYNHIYNNSFYFNHGSTDTYDLNHTQAYDDGVNYWNTTGNPHGYGNFWYDWQSPDSDGDGIVDNAYKLDGATGSQDYYPLTASVAVPEFSYMVMVGVFLILSLLILRRKS